MKANRENNRRNRNTKMAKISPVSIKYMIYASFKAEGPLEKPDVIGAIFGQTEGLLGEAMEMRELQKEGKIGRIEVDLELVDGRSVGNIQVPTALDRSETTIIAAALETIDRIGPTEAEIKVTKIEDVRGNKRDFIIGRAKELLSGLDSGESFGEMAKSIKEDSRALKIQEYGEEKLPSGDISGPEIVVVEGRADVVNLLKNRVSNVIGMNGTKLPVEIAKLGQEKEITLFIDGDRGGELIAKNVINNAKIVYVAVAPDGKEVEELAGKEILIALRRRMSVRDYLKEIGSSFLSNENRTVVTAVEEDSFKGDIKEACRKAYDGIKGTKVALMIDGNFDVIRKVSYRELVRYIRGSRTKVFAVILDGTATSSIVNACDELGVKHLAATNFSTLEETKVNLVSL